MVEDIYLSMKKEKRREEKEKIINTTKSKFKSVKPSELLRKKTNKYI